MASRTNLHNKLIELLGTKNVYYQPPSSVVMNYPAIRYRKNNINSNHADNKPYIKTNEYEIIVISKLPDNPVIEKILELGYARYVRNYVADGLYHDILMLNY